MSERKTQWITVVLAAVLLPFCGGNAQSSGSSESHFLEPCGGGCKGGFECVCGVCTQACDSSTACGDLGQAGSVCAVGAPGSGCGDSICDVLCDREGDCGALGGGFTCQGGRCRQGASCVGAEEAVAAFVTRSKECAADEDCVTVDSSCFTRETCGAAVALARGYDQAEWSRLSSDLATCMGGSCSACAIAVGDSSCFEGKCRLGGGAAPTCQERETEAGAAVSSALEAADTHCLIDTDCTTVDLSSACHASCSTVLSNIGASAVASVIQGLDTGLCATFEADGCQTFPLPCPAPGFPTCIDEVCTQGFCGDGRCTGPETEAGCSPDCYCSDGTCGPTEDPRSCPVDCPG